MLLEVVISFKKDATVLLCRPLNKWNQSALFIKFLVLSQIVQFYNDVYQFTDFYYAFLHVFKHVLNMLCLSINRISSVPEEEFYKDWSYCRICKDKKRWKFKSAKI